MYYELTYNGDKGELYVDAYKKWENFAVPVTNSNEVVRRAQQRLAQARADRESENNARLQQAYAQVPRLREIDMLLRQSMAKAAQAAFLGGGDAQAALEAVKQENLALQ